MIAPETYDTSTKLDRPYTQEYRRSADTRLGVVHAPEGTVVYRVDAQPGCIPVTEYEAVVDGRLHHRRETIARTERGAKIMAGRWLRELAGVEEPTA